MRASLVSRLEQYENGQMDHHEMVELFQELVDNGYVWHLQGSYGRAAQQLLDAGYIRPPSCGFTTGYDDDED